MGLAEKQPAVVSRLLARQLEKAMQMEWQADRSQPDPSRYAFWADVWDSGLETHASQEYKAEMLRAISVIGHQYGSHPAMRPVVAGYLDHPFIVFRRLGVRIVTAHLSLYADLAEMLLNKREILADDAIWPEIYQAA